MGNAVSTASPSYLVDMVLVIAFGICKTKYRVPADLRLMQTDARHGNKL